MEEFMRKNTAYVSANFDLSLEVEGERIEELLLELDSLVGNENNFVEMILIKDNGGQLHMNVCNYFTEVEKIYDEKEDEEVYIKKGNRLKFYQGGLRNREIPISK